MATAAPAAASRAAFWQRAHSCCFSWATADGRTTSTIRRATSPAWKQWLRSSTSQSIERHCKSKAAGGNFCLNIILSHHWEIETVQFMNNAVGCNVFTGICCLLMLMLGLLDKEEGSEAK